MDKQRIVVVDDEDAWLRTIGRVLGSLYHVELARNPDEARAHVRSSPCALAILDQHLTAGESGLALLHQLREIQPGLRALILTAYAELDDAVASFRGGALDYISKGHSDLAAELRARVAKALEEPPVIDEPLAELLARGEGPELEFKSSARWDLRQQKANRALEEVIVKTVAGFLNSNGGVLLIGVDDGGRVIGLRHDYALLRKQDHDGYESFLRKLLFDAMGRDVSPFLRIAFHCVDGEEVCRVTAGPAPHAVYVTDANRGEHLYIRSGNSTQLLTTREAVEYCKVRWK
jgi:ActR/RegA family two-component response regulator